MSDLTGKRILVVDDEADLREIICEDLQFMGATVVEAENGHAAFEIVASSRVDAIVSDIRMPGGDGIELLKRVRDLRNQPPPLVLLITGFADVNPEEAAHLGAQGMLSKPFNLVQLREMLVKGLNSGK